MEEENNNTIEYSEPMVMQGTPMEGRDNIIESLFNTEKRLTLLSRAWRGHTLVPTKDGKKSVWIATGNSCSGGKFTNIQIAALRAVINETNSFTRKTAEECKRILYDANKAFIKDMVNDKTIKKKDYRTLAKTYEHALELFLGLPEGGHGSKVLRDSLAGLNTPEQDKKPEGWMDKLKWAN